MKEIPEPFDPEKMFTDLIHEQQEKSSRWQGTHCSFCGTNETDVKGLVAGPDKVFICNRCVILAHDVLDQKGKL